MHLQINTISSIRTALLFCAFSISTLVLLTACGGGGGGGGGSGGGIAGVVGLSQHGSTNSHTDSRRGDDCMQSGCHATSGSGTGVFITAGTSISAAGGYVEYYADIARTDLRARLEVDAYGNFYTVTAIDILTPNGSGFSPGGYVTIETAGGSRRNMPGAISHTSASCNECHGNTQGAL